MNHKEWDMCNSLQLTSEQQEIYGVVLASQSRNRTETFDQLNYVVRYIKCYNGPVSLTAPTGYHIPVFYIQLRSLKCAVRLDTSRFHLWISAIEISRNVFTQLSRHKGIRLSRGLQAFIWMKLVSTSEAAKLYNSHPKILLNDGPHNSMTTC